MVSDALVPHALGTAWLGEYCGYQSDPATHKVAAVRATPSRYNCFVTDMMIMNYIDVLMIIEWRVRFQVAWY